MQHQLKLRNPLVIFDLETTGINISKDRIVELSFVKAHMNGTAEVLTRKINPEMPIPLETSLIHGIYDEDIKDAPTFKSIAKTLAQFLEGCDLAGFNVLRFDVPMLVEEFLRVGVDFDASKRKIIDAQRIFHMMEPRNLSAAYKFYCAKDLHNAHSAEADTIATFEVLNAQVKHYENTELKNEKGELYKPIQNDMNVLHELTFQKIIDFAGRMVYNEKGVEVFNFGKHKGVPVQDVFKKEPNYYQWIMDSDFALDTKRKLTELKLKNSNLMK